MTSKLYIAPEVVKHKVKIISFDLLKTEKYNNCLLISHDEFDTKII